MQLSIKYRPSQFGEVVGQSALVRVLWNSINMGRVPRAILFSGLHGTGKTTLARLYAKALNCLDLSRKNDVCNECSNCVDFSNSPSIIELDAASNNGVEDIRNIKDRIKRVSDTAYKVVILDECHMLSSPAQAAFLKVLESVSNNVIFMLVTTNPGKLDPTVRSRCMSLPLRPLTNSEIRTGLISILEKENIPYTTEFINELSLQCSGSMRDAIQILDQLIISSSGGILDSALLETSLNIVTTDQYLKVATVLSWAGKYDISDSQRGAVEHVVYWDQLGIDLRQLFLEGLPRLLRDFSVYLSGTQVDLLSGFDLSVLDLRVNYQYVKFLLSEWEKLVNMMKTTKDPKLVWEMYFISVL